MSEVSVDLSLLVEGHLEVPGLSQRLLDLSRLGLRLVKTVNKRLVFQDIARGAGKLRQKLLFKISKLDLELLLFFKNLCFARFQLRLFKVDRDSQKLAFQTTLCHCEVDHVDEAARVGGNLDELVSRCQVKPERWVVVY